MPKIVVWHNPKKDMLFYKLVNCSYRDYKVGDLNSYGHKVVLVIDKVYVIRKKMSLRKKVLSRFIRFLQKINK